VKTIFAQSSKPGKSGVAVFRISGPSSLFALRQLLQTNESHILPRILYNKKIYDPKTNELIDNAMVVYFKSPASFTGEDVVEIHTHGSIAIAVILINTLLTIPDLRLAEPGEFAKRAFLNGKFDLTSAEGIADLIEAETIEQHRQAMRQSDGELDELYSKWREDLLSIMGLLEAYIDFPDEDIPDEILDDISEKVRNIKQSINLHLDDNRRGERLRDGIKLTIIGPPNVGKSSLLNFFMQRNVAIVSNIPGTTRDIIEGHVDIGGYPIILQDTAGIRSDSNDLIEQEGINRAIESAKIADIKILMLDATLVNSIAIDDERLANIMDIADENSIIIINKIDLHQDIDTIKINGKEHVKISVKENIGLSLLLEQIKNLASNLAGLGENPRITRARHRHQLTQALECLSSFNINDDLVLAAEDIRMTIRNLSTIVGSITVDDILAEIFGKFCIGK
jgi:tRNA modification GTPase